VAWLQPWFGTRSISLAEGLSWIALGAVPMAAIELCKGWRARRR
jgi:hypothetical protein